VNQAGYGDLRYRVVYSELCRNAVRVALERAKAKGRFPEVAQAVREIDQRLQWIPLDFGEPLQDLVHLRLKYFIGTVAPFVVRYAVDEERRIVYVSVPFRLLPKSGL
jgi:hypothetical protein